MTSHKIDSVRFTDQSPTAAGGAESGSLCAEGTMMNWVRGVVHSQYVGLVRSGVRIQVGSRADLRIRWSKREERRFIVGQPVIAVIHAEAVRLESGLFRRSKQRWNRWVGRIVLAESTLIGMVYTVKIHGKDWTLKSDGLIVGSAEPGKPWDVVNVVVDPQRVDLMAVGMRSWVQK